MSPKEKIRKLEAVIGTDTVICGFCGKVDAKLPIETLHQRMAEHIVKCENHPLRAATEEVVRLRQEISASKIGLLSDLEVFCRWLEHKGYLDSDWWSERPTVLDQFAELNRLTGFSVELIVRHMYERFNGESWDVEEAVRWIRGLVGQ
jgi:hypothetical protein